MNEEFDMEDMAEVGAALMRAIKIYAPADWSPCDCPSEIVGDLHQMLEDAQPKFSENLPTESGWFWHWDGCVDNAPSMFNIGYRESNGKCFITICNSAFDFDVWCDDYGGYWAQAKPPPLPNL